MAFSNPIGLLSDFYTYPIGPPRILFESYRDLIVILEGLYESDGNPVGILWESYRASANLIGIL
eukprot:229408-Pyramimonas_sp.AAC.1